MYANEYAPGNRYQACTRHSRTGSSSKSCSTKELGNNGTTTAPHSSTYACLRVPYNTNFTLSSNEPNEPAVATCGRVWIMVAQAKECFSA